MNRFEPTLRFLGVLSIVTSVQSQALSAEDDPGELRVRWELIGPRRIANPPFRSDKPEQQHLFGSGKTTSIAIHPTDSRIIYAGAGAWIGPPSSSGLHKSTDGGENWAPASRGLTDLAVEGLWLNPTNPIVLLASTNDGGIFRSVDAGENWTLRYRATEANSIASTPSGLYVSTSAGVVRSQDEGLSWRIDLPKPATALLPGFVDAGEDAIWVRYRNGEVWTKASGTAAWKKVYGPDGANNILNTIKVNPRDGRHAITIVPGAGGDHSLDKVMQTRDGGTSWQLLSTVGFHDLAFDPARENVLYGGTNSRLMISRNGGVTWTDLRLNQDFRLIHTFANRPGWIAAGGDHGMYLSVDYGETWRSLHGNLSNSLVGSLAVSRNTVLTTIWDYNPIFSFDGGASWRSNEMGYEGGKIFINPRDPTQAYCFNRAGTGLYRSSDGGRTWARPVSSPTSAINLQLAAGTLITLQLAPSDKSIAFDPRDPAVVYVCSHNDGVYRSTDRGARFTKLSWPFPQASLLHIDPAGVFYLGVRSDDQFGGESSLQISRDQGATWAKASGVIPSSDVFPLSVSVQPAKLDQLILLTSFRGAEAVWSSRDGGRTFQQDNLGLPPRVTSRSPLFGRAYYYSVEYAPARYSGLVALASADGVFARVGDGRWIRISGGLSSQVFSQVVWDSGYLYVSSYGGGVMRTSADELYALLNDRPRLANLSVLAPVAGSTDSFTLGWVVGGGDSASRLPLVVRAAGPSLASFGVASPLADPRLELFAGATRIGENDNWGGSASLASAMAAVGAFSFIGPSSLDSAASFQVAGGDRSMRVSSAGTGGGTVLAEVYDATSRSDALPHSPRLVNLSVLKDASGGLTAGFVIAGSGAKRVLVRVVGPTLGTAFNVPNVAANPRLTLYSGQTEIAANDNWGGDASLAAAFAEAGAFTLPTTSLDAALVKGLGPGNYSVRVDTPNGTPGVVLVEVYELP